MKNVKENIIISIPIVWSVRNFIYSDIYKLLNENFNVYYLIPEQGKTLMVNKLGINVEHLILYEDLKNGFIKSIFTEGLQNKFNKLEIKENEFFKIVNKPSTSIRSKLKKNLGLLLSTLFTQKQIIEFWKTYVKNKISKNHIKKIKNINPKFILSTTHITNYEQDYFLAYYALGYKIMSHILSFDNLLSRGFVPLTHFSKILVWNNQMKNESERYYEYKSENIIITGTPQFEINQYANNIQNTDYYQMKENSGVNILYCANHYIHTPTEPLLIEKIISESKKSKSLKESKWVVRLHPLDNYNRWNEFKINNPDVIVDIPWENSTEQNWSIPPKEEFLKLGCLIKQSSVILNIGSSITLDAISLNKPVVCVGFSTENELESEYYQKAYHSAHYKNITSSGCFDLAKNMEELIKLLVENIAVPKKNEKERKEVKKSFLGMSDDITSSQLIFNAICS